MNGRQVLTTVWVLRWSIGTKSMVDWLSLNGWGSWKISVQIGDPSTISRSKPLAMIKLISCSKSFMNSTISRDCSIGFGSRTSVSTSWLLLTKISSGWITISSLSPNISNGSSLIRMVSTFSGSTFRSDSILRVSLMVNTCETSILSIILIHNLRKC